MAEVSGLILRLRLRLQSSGLGARLRPHDAGGRDGRPTQRRFTLIACIAHRSIPLQKVADLFAGECLIFEETFGESFEVFALLGNDPRSFGETRLHQPPHFRVDLLRGGLGQCLLLSHGIAEENLLLIFAIHESAEFVGEAPAGHHGAGEFGRLLDVELRARRYLILAEDDFLGNPAAHADGKPRCHLFETHRKPVAFGELHDHSEGSPARNDGRFMNRVGGRNIEGDDRVPALVIGGQHFLLLGHDHAAALGAHHDLVFRILELGHGDETLGGLAASKAASLTRFMRSAPEKPGVPRATVFNSTSGARGTLRTCSLRMRSRPIMSGFAMTILRSKRPGRRSAGSSTSGRVAAAIRMMLSLASKPSISTRSWFKVCSRSSLPPPSPAPRRLPTASISSMKMMQGEFFLACSNMSRTRLPPAPRPTLGANHTVN